MGLKLLVRKPRVALDDFCRDFYDNYLLAPRVRGIDLGESYYRSVQDNVAEVDKGFADVDSELILAEMTIVRFEIFALAWIHHFGDNRAPDQSAYTKMYLVEKRRGDIWANMEPYNQAIARASTAGHSSTAATGRAYLAFFNRTLADSFDKWFPRGFEADCVARAANRLLAKAAWKKGLTPGFLMLTLCDRLGCELNEEGQFRLFAVIRGFYDGTRQAMKQVKLTAAIPSSLSAASTCEAGDDMERPLGSVTYNEASFYFTKYCELMGEGVGFCERESRLPTSYERMKEALKVECLNWCDHGKGFDESSEFMAFGFMSLANFLPDVLVERGSADALMDAMRGGDTGTLEAVRETRKAANDLSNRRLHEVRAEWSDFVKTYRGRYV